MIKTYVRIFINPLVESLRKLIVAKATKELILDAAESLFADSGFQATSLRDITGAAGVNLASVNYHFGSKDALLTALLERHFAPVNNRRVELLDELEAASAGTAKLEDLVRALLSPPFELFARDMKKRATLLRLVGRLHSETDEVRAAFVVAFQPTFRRFTAAFQKASPQIGPEEVIWRTQFLVGAMAHTMLLSQSFPVQAAPRPDPLELLEALVAFGTAGFEAAQSQSMAATAAAQV